MPSLSRNQLRCLTFSQQDAATLRLLGEYLGKQQLFVQQSPEVLEDLRTRAAVESTDASNRIEGIVAPRARVTAIVAKDTEPRDRAEWEIAGYRDALQLIHQTGEDLPLTANVVLQLHGWLHKHLPDAGGTWKTTDNRIVERDAEGNVVRIRFETVAAVATPQAMENLVADYHRASVDGIDPLVAVPLFILDFLCIHPFHDGNGRVSRLLTALLLYHSGYEVGRYISLERLVEQSRETYYEVLETSSNGWHENHHDAMPWVRYFWGILIKAYRLLEERVGTVDRARGSKSQRVREAVLRKVLAFRAADLEIDVPGVSRETIRNVLRQLKRDGLLRQEGRGRAAMWIPVHD